MRKANVGKDGDGVDRDGDCDLDFEEREYMVTTTQYSAVDVKVFEEMDEIIANVAKDGDRDLDDSTAFHCADLVDKCVASSARTGMATSMSRGSGEDDEWEVLKEIRENVDKDEDGNLDDDERGYM